MAESERKIVAPSVTPDTQPFWDAAAAGRLLVKRCLACREHHHYPRTICPFCGSDRTEWRDASGRGTIYSFSVMRRVPAPYAIAYVTLEEGPTMMTNIVDCNLDTIRIGQPVRVVFKPSDGGPPVPMFTPA
jgi:uncharacterized protein